MSMRARRTAAFTLSMLLVFGSSLRSADTLPVQLSDDAFWQLISRMSEPSGAWPWENIVSNEIATQTVIPALKSAAKTGGVFIGVGPEQNFTYIAALRPKIAFIVDIRRQNMVEHLMYKALFELSSNRSDFVSRLFSRKQPAGLREVSTVAELLKAYEGAGKDPEFFQSNLKEIRNLLVSQKDFPLSAEDQKTLETVYTVFFNSGPAIDYNARSSGSPSGPPMPSHIAVLTASAPDGTNYSYLSSEENYRTVRELQMKNLLVPIVGDFAGPGALRAVCQYLKDHGAVVTAFYTSNVEQYLFPMREGQTNPKGKIFYDTVATIPIDDRSVFIRVAGNLPSLPAPGTTTAFPAPELVSIQRALKAVKDGKAQSYLDVLSVK